MKSIRITPFVKASALSALLLAGCSDRFLDKEPLGVLSSETFFQTEEHAVWATNAVYEHLRSWEVHVFSYVGLTDIISDDADKGSTPTDANFLSEIDNFTFDPGNVAFSTVWTGYYRGIHRANIAIERIPEIDMDPDLKARLIGECKFLRGYFYFNLVRWFGDVPLITADLAPDEYEQPRTPSSEVYAQIIKDFEDASAALPKKSGYSSEDLGRATQGAAQGMLARVYLSLGDYPKAASAAVDVIQSGEYSLYPSYADIFTRAGENSSESLFEVQATALETGGAGSQYNEVQGVRGVPNLGWGFNRPSDNLITEYEFRDPRRDATILYVGELLPDGSAFVEDNPDIFNERYNQKAWTPAVTGGNGNGAGNIRILRYADILLIAAEALSQTGEVSQALGYLNQVRFRARNGLTNILPDVTTTDPAQLRDKIWHERRVELAMEQGRWFDLARQGRAAAVLQGVGKTFVSGKHELLPLPQSEIDLSNDALIQNPGY
ncbi:MAG: RagB/SusD family nutrient uptake outer membrane protein [Bacteroidetes bacterium]|nr:MAG: RagB/SusD family nutrient uptake outer membrane protein [Bacteroidota bacterium]